MFAQFRSQYPQGRIQTEMLPKIDGLHAFRAIVSEGESIMGTATAVDSDLEIAEDRAVKRALTIAGLAFDNGFENNYGNYGGHSPMLTQVSREPSSVNSLPSANFNQISGLETNNHPVHSASDNATHTIQAESTPDYASDYSNSFDYMPSAAIEPPKPEPITSSPKLTSEAVDLSDAISKIDVEMERLGWKKEQGRDYLVRTFHKKSRQQLTDAELLQFLSHLKSLATPRQAENDDFF